MKNKNEIITNGTKKMFLVLLLIVMLFMISSVEGLTLSTMENYTITENQNLSFNIHASDYTGSVTYSRTPSKGTITTINDSLATFEWTPIVGENGTYQMTFLAEDSTNNATQQNIITVIKENNPPTITGTTIDSQTVAQVTLTLTTDRACTCKYSMINKSYSQMEYTFMTTNTEGTEYQGKTPSLSQGLHTVYVLCNDQDGNYMTSPQQIPLNINLKPTASIDLSPSPPLKEGTIEVTLTTSEALIDTPDLTYSFDDDTTPRTISLVGSRTSWSGYLVIKNTNSERVGSFTFKGTDLTNQDGTEIISGKLFLVDTQAPDALESINIENQDKRIKLTWEEPSSDTVDKYKIYRKIDSGGVEQVDYLDSSTSTTYYDTDVDYNTAYYYRVSVVDKAGNEGALSKEVFTTHVPVTTASTTSPADTSSTAELDSRLQFLLDLELQKADKVLMDVGTAEETLSRTIGSDNTDAIDATGALATLKSNKNAITDLRAQLAALKSQNLSDMEFNDKVSEIQGKINDIWNLTPLEVRVEDSTSYQEFTNDEKTSNVITEYLDQYYKDISAKDKNAALEKAKQLQDSFVVDVKIIKTTVKYPERTDNIAIVEKTFSFDDSLGDAVIMESIPEKIAAPANITFSEQPFLEKNYVYWKMNGGINGKKIYYTINTDANMADLKDVKSSVFIETDLVAKVKDAITGQITKSTGVSSSGGGLLLVLIIAGVVIICGLFAYYVFWSEIDPEKNADKKQEQKQEKKKIFDVKSALFKKKKETILPDQSERIIVLDKSEDSVHHMADSVEFRRVVPLNNNSYDADYPPQRNNAEDEIKEREHGQETKKQFRTESSSRNQYIPYKGYKQEHGEDENANLQELDALQQKLTSMKINPAKIDDLEEFDALRSRTYEIKKLCDELEEQSIIDFSNKTRAHLEKSLLYIAKRMPPQVGQIKEEHTNEKTEKITAEPVYVEQQHAGTLNTAGADTALNTSKSIDKVAPEGKEFVLADGTKINSIRVLSSKLRDMDDNIFRYHVAAPKNDFANWLRDVFLEYELAHKVRSASSKEEMAIILE